MTTSRGNHLFKFEITTLHVKYIIHEQDDLGAVFQPYTLSSYQDHSSLYQNRKIYTHTVTHTHTHI